jgi:hypothetical protein
MFGDRADELAVKPVRNKNRIKANVIAEKWEAVIMKAFLLACIAAVIIAINWRCCTQQHSGVG